MDNLSGVFPSISGTEDERNEPSDAFLMRQFQTGEEDSFKILFDRYAGRLINFAYRFLRSREEAEDVAQESLLRLYRGKVHFDPDRPFRPWLFSIAIHLISNRLRNKKRHPLSSLDFSSGPSEEKKPIELPDLSTPPPEMQVEKIELALIVQTALTALPENQRNAVILARFENMSYAEIASTLETSIPSVESLLFRAKQTLKKRLFPYVSLK